MKLSCALILASKSPRRREILTKCGVEFAVKTAGVEELDSFDPLEKLPEQNALLKAGAVAGSEKNSWVLGADTMIIFEGRAIGKPQDLSDAFRMLESFSGKSHEVVSGMALVNREKNEVFAWSEKSVVTFKPLTPAIISEYLAKVEVLDKAGAYAIQEYGDMIVESFTGELENIIGLPVEKLQQILKKCDII
ncbi:MAG: septum formation protein Maf [Lentisphaerae bacterium]|nr:septum formation protein Maf [Lentisphaerota bacterium]MBQ4329658.1 septum formation protein Maf [Lentisphaeria bacterium]MBR2721024.1 septum formation protein Maf [Lentisphaeria bacterium]